jgi:hypothetical protein
MRRTRLFIQKGDEMNSVSYCQSACTPLCRPLPRGLIRFDEVVNMIHLVGIFLLGYAILLGLRFNWTVALLFTLQVSQELSDIHY